MKRFDMLMENVYETEMKKSNKITRSWSQGVVKTIINTSFIYVRLTVDFKILTIDDAVN